VFQSEIHPNIQAENAVIANRAISNKNSKLFTFPQSLQTPMSRPGKIEWGGSRDQ